MPPCPFFEPFAESPTPAPVIQNEIHPLPGLFVITSVRRTGGPDVQKLRLAPTAHVGRVPGLRLRLRFSLSTLDLIAISLKEAN